LNAAAEPSFSWRARFHHAPEGNAVIVRNLRVFRPEGADVDV
jgi:hypothetical protein